jgi:hypothetical protein
MIITILEAKVAMEKGEELKRAFGAMTAEIPDQILHSYLARNTNAPDLWTCITVWKSMEALMEYRKTVKVPSGIAMFRSVGSEPQGSLLEVAGSSGSGGGLS